MLKKLPLLWVLACWPSYSYSDSIAPYFGYTGNAITDQSLRWSMGNVLPDPPGVFVDNVIYSYRIDKETGDTVSVYVFNENAAGTGYVFREHDEWRSGSLSGTQINKAVPLGSLHRDLFGPGGIEVDGNGSVYDANVIYTYRVEPCYNPQFDPNCPGYERPYVAPNLDYEIYYADQEGDSDQAQYAEDDEYTDEEGLTEEELAELEDEEEKDREDRLEAALFEAGRAQLFAQALAMSQLTDGQSPNLNPYYEAKIPGGEYRETITLADRDLPDSPSGLRNGLAQQLLHQQMVDSQYKN